MNQKELKQWLLEEKKFITNNIKDRVIQNEYPSIPDGNADIEPYLTSECLEDSHCEFWDMNDRENHSYDLGRLDVINLLLNLIKDNE